MAERTPLSEMGITVTDPYPLPLDDSVVFQQLLLKVAEYDIYMYGILNWYRAVGIVLKPSPKWGYVIRPLIYGQNGCEWGWHDQAEWEKEKQWLKPYQSSLIDFLKEIADDKK